MNSNDGMVLWLLGGTGVFLVYSAYKNQQPQALLTAHINGTTVNAPISASAVPVPTATANDGKTYNTAPGAGGWVTTDPPVPGHPYGDVGTGTLQGYRKDVTGQYNVINTAGQIIGVVPPNYQGTPSLYIPGSVI